MYSHKNYVLQKNSIKSDDAFAGFFFEKNNSEHLVCYEVDSRYYLSVNGKTISISDPELVISGEIVWPYLKTRVKHPELNIEFNEFSPIETIIMKLDPTYDWLDFSDKFFAALILDKRHSEKK